MNPFFKIITFLLLCTSTISWSQENIKAELDSTAILIGDHVGLHLRISNAEGISNPSVNLEPLKAVSEIEIVQNLGWDTLDIMGNIVYQNDLVLTSFDSGYYFIPALSINYTKNGRNISRSTNQLALSVNTLPVVQELEIAPIKDIIREPVNLMDFLPFLLFLLAIGGAILAFYFYRKKQQAKVAPPPPPIFIPAHEIALKQLRELKEAKLWQQGQIKEYQSKLTYTVREYLENRFEIQALEQTSDEILRSMKKNNIDESYRTNLREMFTMADLVKFAKAEPPADANDQLMAYAENFVRKTKKVNIPKTTPITDDSSEWK